LHLTAVTIRRFRNIEALEWQPAPGLNLIWGENGQGKTNLLEAIHVALTGRSFRTHRDEDFLPWNAASDPADPTLAQVVIERRGAPRRLRAIMAKGCKRAFVDDRWLPRLADLWGEAIVVTFIPEEAGLLKGPPAPRRRFLDIVLSQISRPYLEHLQHYNQALRQLNAAYKLASERQAREHARAYYPALARAGASLIAARARRLREAAQPMSERYGALGGSGDLSLRYHHDPRLTGLDPADPGLDARQVEDQFLARLEAGFEEGRRLGLCAQGPHRDDFEVTLNDTDLRRFGSQGQHRLAALTLKLESACWIEMALGEPPVLLLDDFGSELDPGRREAVLGGLRQAMQVLITATHPGDLGPAELFAQSRQIALGRLLAP